MLDHGLHTPKDGCFVISPPRGQTPRARSRTAHTHHPPQASHTDASCAHATHTLKPLQSKGTTCSTPKPVHVFLQKSGISEEKSEERVNDEVDKLLKENEKSKVIPKADPPQHLKPKHELDKGMALNRVEVHGSSSRTRASDHNQNCKQQHKTPP